MVTFKRGVCLPDHKTSTEHKPIEVLPPSEIMVYPLQQHIGAPCVPLVKRGDHVKMYQEISEAPTFMSSPVHASVSGDVIAVEPRPVANGSMVLSVVIKNDFCDEPWEGIIPRDRGTSLPEIVRQAGIVGMGGAGFPTHVKLSPPPDKVIDTILVNGAECEPYLTSDHRVMLETPLEVIDGLAIIMSELHIPNGYIGIEENKADAMAALQEYVPDDVQIIPLRTKYPQGSEKQLIEVITGRRVPRGGLPMDVGVIVVNIDTCTAIGRAVCHGTPLTRRIVTVAGPCVRDPKNLSVRLGTSLRDVANACGIEGEIAKAIMGGPMMGTALSTLDVPVVKATGALLLFDSAAATTGAESSCIRCGRCAMHCPMGLLPLQISAAAAAEDAEKCRRYHLADCIECGVCAYVCPAKRHLVQSFKMAKQEFRRKGVRI